MTPVGYHERKLRQCYRNEIAAEVEDARLMFNGDTYHDSKIVHQAIFNYYFDKRFTTEFTHRSKEYYVKYNLLIEDILYDECNKYVQQYCVNTDGSDDGLLSEKHGTMSPLSRTPKTTEKKTKPKRKTGIAQKVWQWLKNTILLLRYGCRLMLSIFKKRPENERVVVPRGKIAIEDQEYEESSAKEIVLPEGLKSIGNWAFSWSHLEKICLPKSLEHIGHNPFAVTHITDVRSKSKRFVVSHKALIDMNDHRLISYLGMSSNVSFKLNKMTNKLQLEELKPEESDLKYSTPEDVRKLGRDCFRGRYVLKKLIISRQVEEIEPNPIADTAIKEIECLSPHFVVCDKMLMSADRSKIYAYYGEERHITIAEGVTSIGTEAFLLSKIETIDLPASIIECGSNAFAGCDGLKKISLPPSSTKLYKVLEQEYGGKVCLHNGAD